MKANCQWFKAGHEKGILMWSHQGLSLLFNLINVHLCWGGLITCKGGERPKLCKLYKFTYIDLFCTSSDRYRRCKEVCQDNEAPLSELSGAPWLHYIPCVITVNILQGEVKFLSIKNCDGCFLILQAKIKSNDLACQSHSWFSLSNICIEIWYPSNFFWNYHTYTIA